MRVCSLRLRRRRAVLTLRQQLIDFPLTLILAILLCMTIGKTTLEGSWQFAQWAATALTLIALGA